MDDIVLYPSSTWSGRILEAILEHDGQFIGPGTLLVEECIVKLDYALLDDGYLKRRRFFSDHKALVSKRRSIFGRFCG